MFDVYGFENTPARLCAAQATLSDREAADAVAAIYAKRGLIATVWDNEAHVKLATLEPVNA